MELRNTFQSIIALHQREFPLDLQAREMQLPLDGGRIVTVTGIRRCGKSSLLGLTINRLLERHKIKVGSKVEILSIDGVKLNVKEVKEED